MRHGRRTHSTNRQEAHFGGCGLADARAQTKTASYLLPPLLVGLVFAGFQGALFDQTQASEVNDTPIQPGAQLVRGTLGFIFEGNETNQDGQTPLYATTHGHNSMENRIGETALLAENGLVFGTIVAQEKNGYNDWSLIRIHDEYRHLVDPAVKTWTGPTDLPSGGSHQPGDVACMVGHGTPTENEPATRHRCGAILGTFTRNEVTGFRYTANTWRGDSGSPVIHYETGQALGIHLGRQPEGHAQAIDVCSLVERFSAHGHDVRLATAPYEPPDAQAQVTSTSDDAFDTPCLGDGPTARYNEPIGSILPGGGFGPFGSR